MYKYLNKNYEILTAPLTKEQIIKRPENKVEEVLEVHLSDMIGRDLEAFLDYLEQNLVEEGIAMEINYNVVGCSDNNSVLLLVTAHIEIDL